MVFPAAHHVNSNIKRDPLEMLKTRGFYSKSLSFYLKARDAQ